MNYFKEIDLLMITNVVSAKKDEGEDEVVEEEGDEVEDEGDEIISHYVWIKDLGRLLSRTNNHKCAKYPCRRCLHIYSSKDLLEKHIPECKGVSVGAQRIEMPKEGTILEFKDFAKQMKVPYIIYADFECLNVPVDIKAGKSTRQIAKQIPCSFCYIVVRCDGFVNEPKIYVGLDAAQQFLSLLKTEVEEINESFRDPEPMAMT